MANLTNVRRKRAGWLLAPVVLAVLAHAVALAIPRAQLEGARAERDTVLEGVDEHHRLRVDLDSFERLGGVAAIERARDLGRTLVPTDCPAIFAQAALDGSLRRAGIAVLRAEVGAIHPFDDVERDTGALFATLAGRRIEFRGSASVDQLAAWCADIDAIAGPLQILEAVLAPVAASAKDTPRFDVRVSALLMHRPLR